MTPLRKNQPVIQHIARSDARAGRLIKFVGDTNAEVEFDVGRRLVPTNTLTPAADLRDQNDFDNVGT